MANEVLTMPELGQMFRVTPGTARRWVHSGLIQRIKIGRALLVTREDAEHLMASGRGKHVRNAAAVLSVLLASTLARPAHAQVPLVAHSCIATLDQELLTGKLAVLTTNSTDKPILNRRPMQQTIAQGSLTAPIFLPDPVKASYRLRITITNLATGYVTVASKVLPVVRNGVVDLCSADLGSNTAGSRRKHVHKKATPAVHHGA